MLSIATILYSHLHQINYFHWYFMRTYYTTINLIKNNPKWTLLYYWHKIPRDKLAFENKKCVRILNLNFQLIGECDLVQVRPSRKTLRSWKWCCLHGITTARRKVNFICMVCFLVPIKAPEIKLPKHPTWKVIWNYIHILLSLLYLVG